MFFYFSYVFNDGAKLKVTVRKQVFIKATLFLNSGRIIYLGIVASLINLLSDLVLKVVCSTLYVNVGIIFNFCIYFSLNIYSYLFILSFFSVLYIVIELEYSLVLDTLYIYFFNFKLYPAHSRVGRGNLVLWHSVPLFLPNSGGIACWVAQLNAALCLDTSWRNGNINLSKYFISSSGDRTHNQ